MKARKTLEGSGIVSYVDFQMYFYGGVNQPIEVFNGNMNNTYPLYYKEYTNPDTDKNSGYMFYNIYDVQNQFYSQAGDSQPMYTFALDIWESKVLINDAPDYDKIS